MIIGLDSSAAKPNPAQAQAAHARGVRLWGCYPNVTNAGAYSTWSDAEIDVLKQAGITPIGFYFGTADPRECAASASRLGIMGCLDVEPPRGDGAWVDPWLAASGFGIYGQNSVLFAGYSHVGHGHPFYILASYPGTDPGTAWPGDRPHPGKPVAWQWWNTHTDNGLSVDQGWYDDWFAQGGEDQMTPAEKDQLGRAFHRVLCNITATPETVPDQSAFAQAFAAGQDLDALAITFLQTHAQNGTAMTRGEAARAIYRLAANPVSADGQNTHAQAVVNGEDLDAMLIQVIEHNQPKPPVGGSSYDDTAVVARLTALEAKLAAIGRDAT